MITQKVQASQGYRYLSSMSQDGRYILSGQFIAPGILLSKNYGVTWAQAITGVSSSGYANAMSGSGQYMYACCGSRLYRSSNYGDNWAETQPNGNTTFAWNCLTCSQSGQYVVAGAQPGRLFLSTDYGASWSEIRPFGDVSATWTCAAISDDGQYIYAGRNAAPRNSRSTNGGASWSEWLGTQFINIGTLTCSSSGEFIAFGPNAPAKIYGDYGTTLLATSPTDAGQAYGVAMTPDGNRIAVAMGTGRIWLSRNRGASWEEIRPNGDAAYLWGSIAISRDGSKVYMAGRGTAAAGVPAFLAYDWNPGILLNFLD